MSITREQCRSFANDHLTYTVEHLHGLVVRLLEIREHDESHGERDLDYLDMATRNAQIESFALHARALIDFLFHGRRKPTDAVASDYVPAGWKRPKKPPSLSVVNPRVGSEIAHLSYKRIGMRDEDRQWPYLRVWLDLADPLRAFAEAASPDLLPNDVASSIMALTEPPKQPELIRGWVSTMALTATNPLPQREITPGPGTATYRSSPPIPTDGS